MFVIVFKQHGALNCEQRIIGPFQDYLDAEDALSDGRVPLLYGQGGQPFPMGWDPNQKKSGHRYIQPLESVA